jgi:hypothetical protein
MPGHPDWETAEAPVATAARRSSAEQHFER